MDDVKKKMMERMQQRRQGSTMAQIASGYKQDPNAKPYINPSVAAELEKMGEQMGYVPEVRPGQTPEEMAAYERALQKVMSAPAVSIPEQEEAMEEMEMEKLRKKFGPQYPSGRRGL